MRCQWQAACSQNIKKSTGPKAQGQTLTVRMLPLRAKVPVDPKLSCLLPTEEWGRDDSGTGPSRASQ